MSLGKKLFIGGSGTCTTDSADVFGDGHGVALYSLDYDASDASGNYNGSYNSNVTFGVEGKINTAADFTGGGVVTIPNNVISGNNHSVSVWFKLDNTSGYQGLFDFDYNNRIIFRVASSDANEANIGTSGWFAHNINFSANQWYHLVITFSNGNPFKIYVNGNIAYTGGNSSLNAQLVDNNLGAGNGTGVHNVNGNIDQLRIFSKELSATEVSTLYAETACVYTSTTDTLNYQGTNLAYYKFDNTAEDETGTHDGTGYNLSYTFGRFGQCADFNGQTVGNGTYISVPHNTSFSWKNNKTLSLWFKLDSYLSGSRGLAAKGNGGSGPYGWYLYKNGADNKIGFTYYDSAVNAATLVTNNAVDLNTWYHLCITTNGTTDKLYLNGVEEDSTSSIVGIDVNTPLVIGRFYSNFTDYNIDGQIDQVRFYESTLDATAVENLYNEKPEAQPNFNAVTYAGIGNTQYISNVGFQPDLVWIKNRDNSFNHNLYFDLSGAINRLRSNTTGLADTSGNLSSFEPNGFILTGSNSNTNNNNNNYVAWCWKGGGDAVSNPNGDITSQVSANPDAGFSIVKYTGNGTDNATVGTGLSSAAELVIVKDLDNSNYWIVGGSVVGDGKALYLNDTSALLTRDRVKSVQSNTFTLGSHFESNGNGANFIAYCFHSVTGYQKIGSFTYSAGVSVNVGFEPQFVMFKKVSAAGSWTIVDNKRFSGSTNFGLFWNQTAADVNFNYLNLTSTGFTTTYSDTGTFIYLAIA